MKRLFFVVLLGVSLAGCVSMVRPIPFARPGQELIQAGPAMAVISRKHKSIVAVQRDPKSRSTDLKYIVAAYNNTGKPIDLSSMNIQIKMDDRVQEILPYQQVDKYESASLLQEFYEDSSFVLGDRFHGNTRSIYSPDYRKAPQNVAQIIPDLMDEFASTVLKDIKVHPHSWEGGYVVAQPTGELSQMHKSTVVVSLAGETHVFEFRQQTGQK